MTIVIICRSRHTQPAKCSCKEFSWDDRASGALAFMKCNFRADAFFGKVCAQCPDCANYKGYGHIGRPVPYRTKEHDQRRKIEQISPRSGRFRLGRTLFTLPFFGLCFYCNFYVRDVFVLWAKFPAKFLPMITALRSIRSRPQSIE